MQSSKWVEVREEKKMEKTHWTGVGVWGGAASLCHRCVGVELKGFVAVAFSWNWNWRACEAEGYEFSGERECRERISSLKKWKQQQQPFLVLAQTK